MGCGEQNMILFTPNIYVTKYLEATNQLEASFKTKAVNFMKSGLRHFETFDCYMKQFNLVFVRLTFVNVTCIRLST